MELFKLLGIISVNNSNANAAIDETTKKTSSFGEKLGNGIKTVGKWGASIAAAAGTAAAAVGAMAIKSAAAYESNFAKVSTLLTGSQEDFENYKKALLDASTETGIAADEMSEAVYSAISASVDQDSAIEFAKKASALARGGFTDTATAVDVLTTAINAYGLSVNETDKISDMLINTQNLGKTTVNELASSMGKIIPTANSFGVQLDTLCGSYAEITKNGIATAEATTYMNSMLNELGKSGTKASEALKDKTGKSFKECMDSGMSLTDVLGVLQSTANETGVSMGDMFGSAEAAKAAVVLQTNTEDLNKMISSMGKASGTTSEAAGKMAETIETRIGKLKNSLKNMMINIGNSVIPVVEKIIGMVESGMPKIQALFDRLTPIIINLFDSLLPPLIGLCEQIFPLLLELIEKIIPPVVEIIQAILPVIIQLVQILLPPLIQIVEAILPVIVELVMALLPILQPLLGLLQPLLDLIVVLLQPLLQLIEFRLKPIIAWTIKVAEIISKVLKPIIVAITAVFKNVLNPAISGIISITKNVIDYVVNGWNKLKEITSSVFGAIKDAITKPIETASDVIKGVIEKIKGFFGFKVELPKIKLPHFGITPKGWELGDLLKGEIPKLGIDWYAKAMNEPMVMNSPTAFGINGNGQVMAGGEAGSEVVSGTDTLMNMISGAVAAQNERLAALLNAIFELLQKYIPELAETDIFLNDGALVGRLAPAMDAQLGLIAKRKGRG